MIVTNNPDKVIAKSIKNCTVEQPWSTMQKEPIIMREKQSWLRLSHEQSLMILNTSWKQVDPTAFVSVSENVHILGRFVETDD